MLTLFDHFNRLGLPPCGYTEDEIYDIETILDVNDKEELIEDWEDTYRELSSRELEEDDERGLELLNKLVNHYTSIVRADYRKEDYVDDYIMTHAAIGLGMINYEAEHSRFFPEKYNKDLPKKGGWVMIIEMPGTVVKPILHSVYYAIPVITKQVMHIYGDKKVEYNMYKAKIITEEGELCIWPHEYMKVPIDAVLAEVGNSFDKIPLGGTPAYDLSKVHFLAMRGVSQVETYKILLKSVNSMNHVYFKIRDEAVEFWDFYIEALQKGIRPEMALRLWDCKVNDKPLFKIEHHEA